MNERTNLASTRSTAPLIFAIATLSSCTMDAPATLTPTTHDQALQGQLSADSQYMMRLVDKTARSPGTTAIDLADAGQHRFVMNRLAAAGKTPSNSPELFDRLQRSRDKAIARAAAGGASFIALRTDWCATWIDLGAEQRESKSIVFRNTHAEVSCVNGAAYAYADITTYNGDTFGKELFLVQSAAGEDFSGGTRFDTVSISPVFPAQVGRVNKTESMVIAYDDFGTEQITYNLVISNLVPIPGSVVLQHPIFHDWITNGGYIQMCQLRGAPTSCDYGVGSLSRLGFAGWTPNANGVYTGIAAVKVDTGTEKVPWQGDVANYFAFSTPYVPNDLTHVFLPTEGTVDAGATSTADCLIKTIEFADFRLTKTVNGGICTTTTSFKDSIAVDGTSRTATFRTISDFINNGGTGGDCGLETLIRNEDVKPSLTIKMMADCGTGTLVPRFASLAPGSQNPIPQHVFFLNSCFAEGTGIRLANGSSRSVEALEVGDKVISDRKGTVLTVTATSHGGEAEPLVALRDNRGHELRLTSSHPVVKASGEVVLASAIQRNDRVMTDRGIARIVSARRVPYDGQVYNLKLGTPEELARVGANGTTMFAGGMLVGDSAMQQVLDRPRHHVAQLSRAWTRDYYNGAAHPSMTRSLR